ncbi:MAG: calcium-binding protein [Planctomycetes bacterium]|nr:calcium-binding protein [Planctomycetota bacterium]
MSIRTSGVQANAPSDHPNISANGACVAFDSQASNLIDNDSNGQVDVFVRDLQAGVTDRVSLDSAGNQCTGDSSRPALSGDGRFVVFESVAPDLVLADTNGVSDIFLRDRLASTTIRVSVDSTGAQAIGQSNWATISADGQFVAFRSEAANLVSGDTNAASDVFVRDLAGNSTQRVSVDSVGIQANAASFSPSISSSGRWVAFASHASNLTTGDTNAVTDVFVHDRLLASTQRASVDSFGGQSNGASDEPAMSGSGRFVAFTSVAANLVTSDGNQFADCFVHDLQTARTTRISIRSSSIEADGESGAPAIDSTGAFVAFQSEATNLISSSDDNDTTDVFIRKWLFTHYRDEDGDDYGNLAMPLTLQYPTPAPGYSASASDCDDANAAIHPGAPELCNNVDDDCDGAIDEDFLTAYCTAGTTVHGCVAAISGEGMPSSIAPTGFDIIVRHVEGQRYGTLFYGFYQVATPWAPGSLSWKCVANPVTRTGILDSNGTAGACDGELRLDFNAWMQANPGSVGSPFVSGQVFYVQGWFRDPGAPKQTNLSNALRFTLCN